MKRPRRPIANLIRSYQMGRSIAECAILYNMSRCEVYNMLIELEIRSPSGCLLKRDAQYRKEYRREYYAKHKEELAEYMRQRRENPQIRLNRNISSAISSSLRSNKQGRHWEDLVGYTLADLRSHLEKQFTSGMSWDNYGQGWHIDHKIPVSAFLFDSPEDPDFKRCWSLNNLRPAWASYNMSKHDKLDVNLVIDVLRSEMIYRAK